MNKYYVSIPVLLVAFVPVAFSWLFGGIRAEKLLPTMGWAFLAALEVLFLMPQPRRGETIVDARKRTRKMIVRDPAFWIGTAFALLLLIPLFNPSLCPMCDYPKILSGANPDPILKGWLPTCYNVKEHLDVVIWFLPTLAAVLATRISLKMAGKRMLAEILVWNAALLAVIGFIQMGTGAKGPLWLDPVDVQFFSTWGYPNMAGAFFLAAFAFSVGLWQHRVRTTEEVRRELAVTTPEGSSKGRYLWVRAHYVLIPAILCFFGALCTLSRAAILLTYIVAGFWAVYIFFWAFSRASSKGNIRRIKIGAITIGGIAALLLAVSVFAPKALKDEAHSLSTNVIFERVSGDNQYHAHVAMDIFKDNVLFGAGGWGYRHLCFKYMRPIEKRTMQTVGGANVHNDFLQLLAEHGLVGAVLLLTFVAFLVSPIVKHWKKVRREIAFQKDVKLPKPVALYILPMPVVGILLAAVGNVVHALGDCPFRSPAVLSQLLILIACMDGFHFPGLKRGGK